MSAVGRSALPTGARGATITGWGTSLPPHVVTNADFEARLDTTDEWITERTGIKERRHGGTTAGLAIEAGRAALRDGRADRRRHRLRPPGHDQPRLPDALHRL